MASLCSWSGAALAGGFGLYHIWILSTIFFGRITFPADVEWMEGGMLGHAQRILDGKSLYGPPSAEFISYLYTPFYPFLLAALGKLVGLSYLLGRIVSIGSFVGAILIGAAVIVRETRSRALPTCRIWIALWIAAFAGLFAATFPLTEAWFDLVRNDSLHLFLVVLGLYCLRYHARTNAGIVGAAIALALGFLTKQTASLFIVYSGIALLLIRWRALPLHSVIVGIIAGGTLLWLNIDSHGWCWRYIYEMHQSHDFYPKRAWIHTPKELLRLATVSYSLTLLWGVVTALQHLFRKRISSSNRRLWFWFGAVWIGMIVACLGFGTQWAEENAFIPAFYFASLFACLAGLQLVLMAQRFLSTRRSFLFSSSSSLIGGALCTVIGSAFAVHLYAQRYDPAPHIPTQANVSAARSFLQWVAGFDAPVLLPYHPFYAQLSTGTKHFHHMGINDVTRSGYPFPTDLSQHVMHKVYRAIILNEHPLQSHYHFFLGHYRIERVLGAHEVPHVLTGWRTQPTYLLVPK